MLKALFQYTPGRPAAPGRPTAQPSGRVSEMHAPNITLSVQWSGFSYELKGKGKGFILCSVSLPEWGSLAFQPWPTQRVHTPSLCPQPRVQWMGGKLMRMQVKLMDLPASESVAKTALFETVD